MDEILILERTIELLVAAGHVAQEKVEEARRLAISLTKKAAQQGVQADGLPLCKHEHHESVWHCLDCGEYV